MPRSAARRTVLIAAASFTIGLSSAVVAPAFAQNTVDEVVVTAKYQGRQLRSLSVPVSYRDLDLTTDAGRETLKQRVKAAADDACKRLGEGNMGGTYAMPSCERAAIDSATGQEQLAFAQAKPGAKAPAGLDT